MERPSATAGAGHPPKVVGRQTPVDYTNPAVGDRLAADWNCVARKARSYRKAGTKNFKYQ
jgi:hypothetical protein